MFGRRISASGWMKLGALALGLFAVLFVLVAPLWTMTVRIDLQPATTTVRLATAVDLLVFSGWIVGCFAAVAVLIVFPVWLVVGISRRILRGGPRAR